MKNLLDKGPHGLSNLQTHANNLATMPSEHTFRIQRAASTLAPSLRALTVRYGPDSKPNWVLYAYLDEGADTAAAEEWLLAFAYAKFG